VLPPEHAGAPATGIIPWNASRTGVAMRPRRKAGPVLPSRPNASGRRFAPASRPLGVRRIGSAEP